MVVWLCGQFSGVCALRNVWFGLFIKQSASGKIKSYCVESVLRRYRLSFVAWVETLGRGGGLCRGEIGGAWKVVSGFSYHFPRKGSPRFLTEGRRSMTKSGLACVYCV